MSKLYKRLTGGTIKVTWVNSSVVPGIINLSVFTGSETLISSAAMVSSGGGHFYATYTLPTSPGYYSVRTEAFIDGNPWPNRRKVKAVAGDVD